MKWRWFQNQWILAQGCGHSTDIRRLPYAQELEYKYMDLYGHTWAGIA